MNHRTKLALAGAAVLAVCVAAPVTAAAAAAHGPVHHSAWFGCVSHNGAGGISSLAGHPVACPAGSILDESDYGTRGPAGPQGPKGDTGAKGDKGDPGTPGTDATVGDILHNSSAPVSIPPGGEAQSYATCAADPVHGLAPNGTADGYVAVGGGWSTDNGSGTSGGKVVVSMSRDELTNTAGRGWLVTAYNNDTSAHTVYAWVICIAAPADKADT